MTQRGIIAVASALRHGDDPAGVHMSGSSIWVVISMIAFSIFLLTIAWTLVRPKRRTANSARDAIIEHYAQGKLDDDEVVRLLRGIRSRHS